MTTPPWQLDVHSLDNLLIKDVDLEVKLRNEEEERELCVRLGLNPAQVRRCRKHFSALDATGSGVLDRQAFNNLIGALADKSVCAISPSRLALWWQSADAENSGKINFTQFIVFYHQFFADNAKGVSVILDGNFRRRDRRHTVALGQTSCS
jgi:hypothetical protein